MKTTMYVIQVLPNGTNKQVCKIGGNGASYPDLNTILKTGRITNIRQTVSDNGIITLSIIVEEL
jgi:hypothetical protein